MSRQEDTPLFSVKQGMGPRPFKILDATGTEVGSSETRDKADRSIVHRLEAIEKKQQAQT